jgi:hypothetical protein
VATPQSPRACPFHNSDNAFPDRLIAEVKCRPRPVLPLVNLTRGRIQSEPARATGHCSQCCVHRSRATSGPLSALEILLHSRPPWPTRESLLGRVVERVPQLTTPSRTRWRSTVEWRKRQGGRKLPRGAATFQEAHGAAGPRRALFKKAQLDKPHDLVTPSTIAAQLRQSHRRAYTTPAWRPPGSRSASAMGAARP